MLLGVGDGLAVAEADARDQLTETAGAVEATPAGFRRPGELEDLCGASAEQTGCEAGRVRGRVWSQGGRVGEAALGLGDPEPR